MSELLKQGQFVNIKGKRFKVVGMISYREDSWKWQEYKVQDDNYGASWLCVEDDEGVTNYTLYRDFGAKIGTSEMEYLVDGKRYSLHEKGNAIVTDYFGRVDVDKYETCEFTEYINDEKNSIIAVEEWDGETEYSIGDVLRDGDLEITQEIDQATVQKSTHEASLSRKVNFFVTLFFVAIFGIPLFSTVSSGMGLFVNKSIDKYLSKSSNFTYVTSITNSTNNKKAKVYKTTLGVDAAVKNIISGIPEGITKTVTETETGESGIGLFTKNEYAYVYLSDDKQTLVQVSNTDYVNSSNTLYRSNSHSHYYRTFSSMRTTSDYDSYAKSARQSSINSRMSSGGGTSSGK